MSGDPPLESSGCASIASEQTQEPKGGSFLRYGCCPLGTQITKGEDTMTLGFGQVVVDSQRADDIAAFWSAFLERPIMDGANQFIAMIPASDDRSFPALMFLAVPEPRQGKNRMHFDLVATDIDAAVERAVSLGATKVADFDEYGTRWTTMTDPEGNVFDIGLPPSA